MPSSATEDGPARGDVALPVPLRALARHPVHACLPHTPVRQAVETMRRASIGSIVVTDEAERPIGILTLRDVVDRVVLAERLDAPIAAVMTPDPVCLGVSDNAYDAALLMVRRGVRHVVLTAGDGRLAGIVSERDLFGMQTSGVRHLSGALKGASDLASAEALGREIQSTARQMLEQGTAVGPLTAFIASLVDLLTERLVQLALDAASIDADLCWLVLGSEGRGEQTLATDQDNALVFTPPAGTSPERMRERLVPIARRINLALDRAGYRLCPGEIMAGNAQWCLSVEEWQARFAAWIDSGSPQALLHSATFFDLRPLTGSLALGKALRAWIVQRAARNRRFLHQMAGNALANAPALGRFNRFVRSEHGDIDLKLHGVMPFVDAARVLSLGAALDEVRTDDRLRRFGQVAGIAAGEVEAWVTAFQQLQGFRLQAQAARLAAGETPGNRVDPDRLNPFDQQVLKLALRGARSLRQRVALDYEV